MIRKVLFFLTGIILLITLSTPTFSSMRKVEYTGELIVINTTTDKTTEVVFPTLVKHIVTNFNQTEISLEFTDKYLYIQPILAPQGNIFIITKDNTSYPLLIKNTPYSRMDDKVVIVDKEYRVKQKSPDEQSLVYMQELLTGDVATAQIIKTNHVVYKNPTFQITILRKYDWTKYTGYLCLVKNLTDESIVIPIQQMSLPGLKAVSIDQDVLRPKQTTNLYLLIEE